MARIATAALAAGLAVAAGGLALAGRDHRARAFIADRQALAVALLAIGLVVAATIGILMLTQFTFDQVLFEVVSAFGTVGLSTGITAQLPAFSQAVLIVTMIFGVLLGVPTLRLRGDYLAIVTLAFGETAGGARVLAILNWITENVDYEHGVSDTETTAARTFIDRAGVCRDFTHLGMTLCRASGIPARAVSAYAHQLEPPDFQAVFEVDQAEAAVGLAGEVAGDVGEHLVGIEVVVVEQHLAQLGDEPDVVLGVEEPGVDAERLGDVAEDLGGQRPRVVLDLVEVRR